MLEFLTEEFLTGNVALFRVEFMSKFYLGQGYPFAPFCFKTMLAAAEGADD